MHALRWMLLGFSVLGAFASLRASLAIGHDISEGRRQTGQGIQLAQRLPFERNKIEPIDPKAAFVEGYHSYQRHDLIATIGRMRFAARSYPNWQITRFSISLQPSATMVTNRLRPTILAD